MTAILSLLLAVSASAAEPAKKPAFKPAEIREHYAVAFASATAAAALLEAASNGYAAPWCPGEEGRTLKLLANDLTAAKDGLKTAAAHLAAVKDAPVAGDAMASFLARKTAESLAAAGKSLAMAEEYNGYCASTVKDHGSPAAEKSSVEYNAYLLKQVREAYTAIKP